MKKKLTKFKKKNYFLRNSKRIQKMFLKIKIKFFIKLFRILVTSLKRRKIILFKSSFIS